MADMVQLAFCVVPEYVVPHFTPGKDVGAFLRELSWASAHNRVLYEFAHVYGWPIVRPPSLIDEARRALAYARLIRRLPAAERVARIVQQHRAPVPTVTLAVEIGASIRTAYNYAAALESAGLLRRRSPKSGWIVEGWN